MNDNNSNKTAAVASQNAPGDAPVVSLEALLATHKEVVIMHGTERYRLRITSNNKLILTK